MRHYIEHRHAWTPRFWPMALGSAALVAVFVLALRPGVFAIVGIAVGVAVLVGNVRWAVWRHRHPVVPPDIYITELIRERRQAARWN
jgi:hypothetical protein